LNASPQLSAGGDAKPAVALKDSLVRILVGSAGGGAGLIVALAVLDILRQQPQMLSAIVGWGPLFVVVIIAMIGADRRMGQFIAASERNAVSIESFVGEQRRVADSTHAIAESMVSISQKDDMHARSMEAAIGSVAQTNETILQELRQLRTEKKNAG